MTITRNRALKFFSFSAGASAAFILTLAGAMGAVDAASSRYHPVQCWGGSGTSNGALQGAGSSSEALPVVCGIDNHDGVTHSDASDLKVYVRDGFNKYSAGAYISAKACVRSATSGTYYCGSSATADWQAGYETINPPLTYWNSTYLGYMGYVIVNLADDGYTPDELTAITLWNP